MNDQEYELLCKFIVFLLFLTLVLECTQYFYNRLYFSVKYITMRFPIIELMNQCQSQILDTKFLLYHLIITICVRRARKMTFGIT